MNEAGFANAGKSGQCRLKRLFFNLEPTAIDLPRSMPPSWRSVAAWRAEICCVPRLTTIPRKDGWLLSVVFMHIYANSGLAMRAHLASKKL
ncbi:hypothetical protein [Mesorhizobium sp.]|uniref:hypothetical protein n=1 Tax=Mesorhizobium sp. TaxID=1871066 RepID=UPI002580FFDA|nr:hypothetical protein [Mesorhizobium sp.]